MPDRHPQLGDWRTFAELDTLTQDRLPAALAWARRVPFYAERLPTEARFFDLPFLEKEDLRRAYPFGLLAVPKEDVAVYLETSGTTGEPTTSCWTERDWQDAAERQLQNAVNLRRGDWVFIKVPYAMSAPAHLIQRAAHMVGATIVPADARSAGMPFSKVVRLLHDLPVSVIYCLSTEALVMARAAELAGHDPARDFPNLRAFVVLGEALSEAQAARIKTVWNVDLFQTYGTTESGGPLALCCSRNKMHLSCHRYLFEVLDEQGESHPEGTGMLVVTSLWLEAVPLVRYRLGDIATIERRPCECGWILPTVRVHRRKEALIRTMDVELDPTVIDDLVHTLPKEYGAMFWRARYDDRQLAIEVESVSERGMHVVSELVEAFRTRFGIVPEIHAVPQGRLLPGSALTARAPVTKPRRLFRMDEDWDRALGYDGLPSAAPIDSGRPADRSQRAGLPHWAPTSGVGAEAVESPKMLNTSRQQPAARDAHHPSPINTVSVIPLTELPAPSANDLRAKPGDGAVGRDRVVPKVPADD
jgi:phenylacetate-CoA ligase